ncbi:MAG: hypothetical protein Q7V62_02665, partial [Actinomycetota bacterium]|nr:hypothetical protein [Actinomycetota bacterium]
STWNASGASAGSHTILATAYDAAGNHTATSVSVTVPAAPDTTPPPAVTSLIASRTGSVTLWWTNPPTDFAGVRILRSTVAFASSPADTLGQLNVYEGTDATYHDATAPDYGLYYSVYTRDAAGNYSVRASVQLPAVVAAPAPVATSLTLTSSATRVLAGRSVVVRGKLTAAGVAVPGRTDVAVWKKVGGVWFYDSRATYNPGTGYYEATRTLRKQTSYQLRFAGDNTASPQLLSCASGIVTVGVTTHVSKVSVSKSTIRSGGRVALSVSAVVPQSAVAKVKGYRLVGKRWKYRGTYTLRALTPDAATMRYGATVKVKRRGLWRFVAVVTAENGLTNGPVSRKLRVR